MSSAHRDLGRTLAPLVLAVAFGALAVDSAFAQPQAPPSAPVTVVNTTTNPVPVTAVAPLPVVGTISLSEPVAVLETFAPGRAPRRYGPIEAAFTGSLIGHQLVPPVPASQTFIVTHLQFLGFSNISTVPLARGTCSFLLQVNSLYTPFLQLQAQSTLSALSETRQMFLPLAAGESLHVFCSGVAGDGSAPSQGFRVTAGGYFAPAPPVQ